MASVAAGVPQPAGGVQNSAPLPSRAVARAFSIEDLRRLARRRLPRGVFDLFDGGAEDEATLRDNRAAFERVRLMPKVLVDVSQVDTGTTLLGAPSAMPIAIAPTGAVGFGWRGGDCLIARAAQAYGLPYSLSTSGTASIERIAEAAPNTRRWFQAYILKQREFTMRLVERAQRAGYEGLMITVDLAVGGKRERDYRNDFAIPFRFTPRNVFDCAQRPTWAFDMLLRGMPVMENLVGITPTATDTRGIASTVGRNYDPSFDWSALREVRDAWGGKLIVKGIVRPDDAIRAAELGADAVIVSNHGGRQLDGGVATLDALPGVVAAVGQRVEVYVDGGVRRGVDVVKALALGARAVLIGRPTLYGVCAGGEAGALRALEILRSEFVRAMQLCGVTSVAQIGPDLLAAPAALRVSG
ncbi:MAG: alpha-hydroxy-acid oxidizing protein [Burkholderiales bacterium]|nr:alpha-hydroxy-acid oxidizing protein [Burkholderiales bacterium]